MLSPRAASAALVSATKRMTSVSRRPAMSIVDKRGCGFDNPARQIQDGGALPASDIERTGEICREPEAHETVEDGVDPDEIHQLFGSPTRSADLRGACCQRTLE